MRKYVCQCPCMFAFTHVFIYGAGLTIARARGRDAMRRTRDGVRRPWTRRCASRRNRGHGANEREAWEGAGRPAGLSFAIVIGAFVIVDVVENTMSLEPKLDPDCPRRSVRAARLLLYDPDGSELNGKYGSAFQMTCNEGVHNSECVLTIVTKFLSSMDRALSRFSWSTSTMSL